MDQNQGDGFRGLMGPMSHTYFSQRLRLHYLDWGNPTAPSLMLVHGNRDHAHNWDWVADRFRDDYHIIAPDLRGHGDSQWSTGAAYGPSEYAYDLAQLIHQQALAPLRMVAHSLGGVVSLRYAGIFPEQVTRLVVVEGTGAGRRTAQPRTSAVERMQAWIDNQRSLAGRHPRRYESLDAAYQRMLEANPHLSPEQAAHLTIHGANQNEDGSYSWKFDNYVHAWPPLDLTEDDVSELWANITCPVLLITGSESWQRDNVEKANIIDSFADAHHVVMEGAGHWVHHDQLSLFVALVRDFLS
jgi:pimeloyl-ACP methyl ester carboxylesterase